MLTTEEYKSSNSPNEEIIWKPFPKQSEALSRLEYEILFGGSRGPGKTDAGINFLLYDIDNPKLRALIIRRNADDLRDWSDRANQIYFTQGAVKAGNPPEFRFPSGAIFRTGHLKDDQAYTKYQGHEYHRMLIEELTQIPTLEMYLRLLASCRSTVKELPPQVFATTNPGGIGHGWVKSRFIDPSPPGIPFVDKTSGRSRIFIKATIDDNPILKDTDPDYVKSLDALKDTNEELYRAWRFGDWDIFSGQIFAEFRRDVHVIKRMTPKKSFTHLMWMDWGYSAPHAVYASVLVPMKTEGGEVFNRVITYKEWYDTNVNPADLAERIYKQAPVKFDKATVDPAMLNTQTDGSRAIGDIMMDKWKDLNHGNHWVQMERGNNKRISQVPTIKNWLSMAPDGVPYWLITDNCTDLIRTLPLLVYDEHKVEEIETTQEDHAADSVSYGLKAIKFISVKPGSYGKTKARPIKGELADMEDGKQKSLDLSKFARVKAPKQKRSWKSV